MLNGTFGHVECVDLLACRIVHVDLTCGYVDVTARVNCDTFTPAICENLHINQSTVGTDRTDPRCLRRLVGDISRLSDRDMRQLESTQLTAAFFNCSLRVAQYIM